MEREQVSSTLEFHNYHLVRQIGHGGFSDVFLVVSEQYNTTFVAKVINLHRQKTGHFTSFETYMNELSSLKKILHKHVINLYNHFCDSNKLYLIFEYCPNGNLKEYVQEHGPMKREEFISMTRAILEALQECHHSGICHHDIKPDNVFLDAYMRPKLGDFGLACQNEEDKDLSTVFSGTLAYFPPELIKNEPFDPKKRDVWALGITLYYFVTGGLPWPLTDKDSLFNAILSDSIDFPKGIDTDICNLILSMTIKEAEYRPSVDDILKNPIFALKKFNIRNANSASVLPNLVSTMILNPKKSLVGRGFHKVSSISFSLL